MFIPGRYNKLCRDFGQTPWLVEGGRKIESSVQEKICESLLGRIKPIGKLAVDQYFRDSRFHAFRIGLSQSFQC